jgi:transposase-like protein
MNAIAEVSIVPEDVEVAAKARRRRFTAKYKQDLLRRAAACSQPGEIGALLRSEGLYSSHLTTWRQAQERGELAGLEPKKRGRKPALPDPRERELTDLRRQLVRATARAERAEALVEVQKKVAMLLGVPFESEKS